MKSLMALSLVLVLVVFSACGSGSNGNASTPDGGAGAGGGDPVVPILAVDGTISAAGRSIVPTYGVAGLSKSGTSSGMILSDAPMGCAALTTDYTSKNMPAAGTYVSVALPSFDLGVAATGYVQFMVVSKYGGVDGLGSTASKVEILDATDSAVTLGVDYHDTLNGSDYVVSGNFTTTRCPSN
jgi:hypothetical protein